MNDAAPGSRSRDPEPTSLPGDAATEVTFHWNGAPHVCRAGTSVAAALLNAGVRAFRRTPAGAARAPLCGMGICYECRVIIDGRRHLRACMIDVADGMEIGTDDAAR